MAVNRELVLKTKYKTELFISHKPIYPTFLFLIWAPSSLKLPTSKPVGDTGCPFFSAPISRNAHSFWAFPLNLS